MSAAVWSEPHFNQRRIPVRVRAWGVTEADVECAVRQAGWGESRKAWEFADVECLDGGQCPIGMQDPKAIAAEATDRWAYAVYAVTTGTFAK